MQASKLGGVWMQAPQTSTPAGARRAQRWQRVVGWANRATQALQLSCEGQVWQNAHWLGTWWAQVWKRREIPVRPVKSMNQYTRAAYDVLRAPPHH